MKDFEFGWMEGYMDTYQTGIKSDAICLCTGTGCIACMVFRKFRVLATQLFCQAKSSNVKLEVQLVYRCGNCSLNKTITCTRDIHDYWSIVMLDLPKTGTFIFRFHAGLFDSSSAVTYNNKGKNKHNISIKLEIY